MNAKYYRTDREVTLAANPSRKYQTRTFTKAGSHAEARMTSKHEVPQLFSSEVDIHSLECVIDVPGVTRDMPAQVWNGKVWFKVYVTPPAASEA